MCHPEDYQESAEVRRTLSSQRTRFISSQVSAAKPHQRASVYLRFVQWSLSGMSDQRALEKCGVKTKSRNKLSPGPEQIEPRANTRLGPSAGVVWR